MAGRALYAAATAVALLGCATGNQEGEADTAVDTGPDVEEDLDATPDPDAAMDPDSSPDTGPGDPPDADAADAAEDVAGDPDSGDPPVDTGVDTGVDGIADSGVDTGLDTIVDSVVDTIVDSVVDSPVDTLDGTDVTGPLPDLVVEDISRDTFYYRVQYCNRGSDTSTSTFLISITHVGTGASFESNPAYPFSVPAVGTCTWTGGFTCSLIGPGCTASLTVLATVDTRNTVVESREDNNEYSVSF